MILRPRKILTGLDISGDSVKIARIEKGKNSFRLISCHSLPLPQDTIKFSFKTKNIINPDLLREIINKALGQIDGVVSVVGLSIPNEITKILIQEYKNLPESKQEIKKIIAWKTEESLHISARNTKISYDLIKSDKGGVKPVLITVGNKDVIKDFELCLKKLKIFPKVIRPAGINQLNFFITRLPLKGTIAYLGLFEYFFTFFVFEDAKLTFYHGIRRGFSNLHFFQDIDMVMLQYLKGNPGMKIEKLYVGTQVGFHEELQEVFTNLSNINVQIFNEKKMIETGDNFNKLAGCEDLSSYISAIGAAQSLVF